MLYRYEDKIVAADEVRAAGRDYDAELPAELVSLLSEASGAAPDDDISLAGRLNVAEQVLFGGFLDVRHRIFAHVYRVFGSSVERGIFPFGFSNTGGYWFYSREQGVTYWEGVPDETGVTHAVNTFVAQTLDEFMELIDGRPIITLETPVFPE